MRRNIEICKKCSRFNTKFEVCWTQLNITRKFDADTPKQKYKEVFNTISDKCNYKLEHIVFENTKKSNCGKAICETEKLLEQ